MMFRLAFFAQLTAAAFFVCLDHRSYYDGADVFCMCLLCPMPTISSWRCHDGRTFGPWRLGRQGLFAVSSVQFKPHHRQVRTSNSRCKNELRLRLVSKDCQAFLPPSFTQRRLLILVLLPYPTYSRDLLVSSSAVRLAN